MQLNDMPKALMLLVVVGLVVGIGVVILDQFGIAVKTSTIVINESITTSSGTGTTANDDLFSVQYFGNYTNSTDQAWISIDSDVNWSVDGTIIVSTTRFPDGIFNISYTYDKDSAATAATFSARDATDDFVTWIPVIVILLSMAIILGVLITSFKQ